ncbi:MAG: DUF4418 family protein [Anaerolineaceae bacterium]|jgi:hypothetical protein|nr:DUF4418 family protein [Anaerolineaceae bacterium]
MKVASFAIMVLAVLIGVVPMFTDCESAGRMLTLEDGRQVSMKCHWTARAELGLALPLLAVGAMMPFSKNRGSRRMLGIAGAALGIATILLPTELIGVCMNPSMPCVSTMKPALLLMGALVLAIGLVTVGFSWGREPDQP